MHLEEVPSDFVRQDMSFQMLMWPFRIQMLFAWMVSSHALVGVRKLCEADAASMCSLSLFPKRCGFLPSQTWSYLRWLTNRGLDFSREAAIVGDAGLEQCRQESSDSGSWDAFWCRKWKTMKWVLILQSGAPRRRGTVILLWVPWNCCSSLGPVST